MSTPEGTPTPEEGAADRPTSILFVCTGNICRSPIAERILRGLAERDGLSVTVTSAGVGAQNSQPMHPLSVEVLTEHGYDATGFESRYLRPQIVEGADLVLGMTREHRASCQRLVPARWKRMFTLTEFAALLDNGGLTQIIDSRSSIDTNSDELDISDPMGRPKADFERVLAEIEPRVAAVERWLGGASEGVSIRPSFVGATQPAENDPSFVGATQPSEGESSSAGRVDGERSETSYRDQRPEEPKGTTRRWYRSPKLWAGVGIVVLLLVIAGGWLAYSATKVKSDLEAARSAAQSARTSILDGDQQQAQRQSAEAASRASAASDRTHGFVWQAAAAIPWLGQPLKSVSQISDAVDSYASEVIVPSARLASVLNPSEIRSGDTINTKPLAQAQPQLAELAERSAQIGDEVAGIDPSWSSTVADARDTLGGQVDRVSSMLEGTNVAAQLVPGMLGTDGPRNYFLALQTPSESRGTGGLVGGFGIINATDGTITAPTLGANSQLRNPARAQVDLGQEYDWLYSQFKPYTDFRNNNLSSNFPDAAQIWIANWKAQSGQQLDGAIALDPIALSYVLKVTGPVTLPGGEKITADNVVPITLSTSYQRFSGDNNARKTYLQSISKAVVEQVGSYSGDTGALLEALGRGVHERRIMVYSTDPDEQKVLETTNLAHQVSDTDAPYLEVALGNAGGNKLDYYLRREISYTSGACTGDTRTSTVTVRLTNTLEDLNLPDYVIAPNGTELGNVEKGTNLVNVEMLLTKGATVTGVEVDGQQPPYIDESLHGRPYVATMVRIPPGSTSTVTLTIEEPTAATGEAQVPVQPLVDDPAVEVNVPVCR